MQVFIQKNALFPLCDDVDYHRGTHNGRYGIKGDDTVLAGKEAYQITDQSDDGTTEDGGRKQHTVVVGGQQQTGDMRHGKSDKRHRSAKGGGDGRQQACDD